MHVLVFPHACMQGPEPSLLLVVHALSRSWKTCVPVLMHIPDLSPASGTEITCAVQGMQVL